MSIRWIKDGEPHSAEVYNRPLRDYIQDAETTFAKQSLNIEVSNGLSGGGKLVGDVVKISANDASTQQKGVVRFATLEEANEGTPGVVVSPDVVKEMGVGLGAGQKWMDVLQHRRSGETYVNDTGNAISISVSARSSDYSNGGYVYIYIDGMLVSNGTFTYRGNAPTSNSIIVPNGSTYRVVAYSSTLVLWVELR